MTREWTPILVVLGFALASGVPQPAFARSGIKIKIQNVTSRISHTLGQKHAMHGQMRTFLRQHGQSPLPRPDGRPPPPTVAGRKRELEAEHHLRRRRFMAYVSTAGTVVSVAGAIAAVASSSPVLASLAVCSATFSGLRSRYFRRSLSRHRLMVRGALLAEFAAQYGDEQIAPLARSTRRALARLEARDRQHLERAEANPLRWITRRYWRKRHQRSQAILDALGGAFRPPHPAAITP